MIKKYPLKNIPAAFVLFSLLSFASCKKDNTNNNAQVIPVATPTKLGLYEADSAEYRELIVAVSKIGNQSIDDGLIFDTGSGGMVIDAQGLIPATMISSSGFTFTGDSTVVNGITITKQTATLQYGADSSTLTTVYGNLAYAPVTLGDQGENVIVKRLPFCIYYKATDANGKTLSAHYFDTFGVNSEYIYFSGNSYITSPFSYFDPGSGLTKGFKMAALGMSNFSLAGTYVPGLVTLGLTSSDVSSSSGFTMHTVNFYQGDGYVPIFPTSVSYNSKSISTNLLFDSGTSGYSYIEDTSAASALTLLPQGTQLTVTTNAAFVYTYTTEAAQNLTYIENPNLTGGQFSIMSIDFFLTNEYMQNFSNQQLGLKSN
ncbi:MAG TPA: hypothetical protein VFE53_12675 [Mucilaginibacter sp.]|jgi:hypothetical protein|nr:hypothetical protein [Mucilaginibacter sp.]